MLDLPHHRTHLLFHLLSSQVHRPFKLHFTANLLLKERFCLSLIQSAIKQLASKKDTEDEDSKGAIDRQDEEESFFPGGGDGNFSTESFFEEVYKQNLGAAQVYVERCQALKVELNKWDKNFVDQVLDNVYIKCTRVGLIWKCTQRMLKADEWTEKFCIITNAGIVYFNTQKKGDYDPRKFYPLNDFVVVEVEEKAAKRPHAFKIIFERAEVCKELIMACNSA
jgi:hypothetical protein